MKDNWQQKTLGEVCIVDKCQGVHKGLPYVGLEHIESQTGRFIGSTNPVSVKSSTFRFSPEHILYGRLRPYLNKVMMPDFTGHCSTEIFPIKPSKELLREFLQYWFLMDSTVEQINSTSTGARMPRANMNAVLSFGLQVPPLSEQHRIVRILDVAFEDIATAKANTEKNLQNARSLFESYHHFVFLSGSKKWEKKPLGEVCEYVNGKAHEQCIDKEGQFIVINSKFIATEGEIVKRSNEALLPLQPNDIAMVLSDVPKGKALAKCFHVDESDKYTLNQRICLIRSPRFDSKFLFYQLNRNGHFLSFDNEENQTNLRLNQVLSCPLYVPSFSEQRTVAANLKAVLEESRNLESVFGQKLNALEALKKSLLHQAFTGNL